MVWLGEYEFGTTVFHKFTTVNSTGAPVALSSAGVTVYRNASTVQSASGVALVSTFDTVVGLNHVTVSMSSTGFYSSGGHYVAIISSGAGSESLAGYVLCEWAIGRRVPQLVSTAVAISTASVISTAQTIASAASITSTVAANVNLWRGVAPSTLGTNSHLRVSTTSAILSASTVGPVVVSTAVNISTASLISTGQTIASAAAITSTVAADVNLWRSVAPSTLGTNAHVRISTTSAILSVSSAGSVGSVTNATKTGFALASTGLDAITLTEPSTGPPPDGPTLPVGMAWHYYTLPHQIRVNATNKTFFDSSGGVLWTKGLVGDSATYIELLGATAT